MIDCELYMGEEERSKKPGKQRNQHKLLEVQVLKTSEKSGECILSVEPAAEEAWWAEDG